MFLCAFVFAISLNIHGPAQACIVSPPEGRRDGAILAERLQKHAPSTGSTMSSSRDDYTTTDTRKQPLHNVSLIHAPLHPTTFQCACHFLNTSSLAHSTFSALTLPSLPRGGAASTLSQPAGSAGVMQKLCSNLTIFFSPLRYG